MKRNTLVTLAFATILFAIPALSQANSGSVIIDLRTGTYTLIPPLPYGLSLPRISASANPNCVGWYEAHIDINLQPGPDGKARTAYITAEYEGTPYGWTVDIGDSATDNGYGGNSGGPEHAAEVQVVDQWLSVYNDPKIPGQVDNLLTKAMALTGGSLKFEIANQTLSVGAPAEVLATPVTQTLFWIPDPLATGTEVWSIHAAFNHVVDAGTNRSGCGVRSAIIWTGTGGI